MANEQAELVVKSHVSRDILQSAALFTSAKLVVWEYVSNGLQYVDQGVSPVVSVSIDSKAKKISIRDNGSGMDIDGLGNFFIMHGENQERKQGRAGRGFFGTGKSAAFGIANLLRITSVKDGMRYQVELHRDDIQNVSSGEPIPVRTLDSGSKIDEANGTLIEIEQIHLRSLTQTEVINYIERHLSRWNRGIRVLVNNHVCEFSEPPIADVVTFRAEGEDEALLGEVVLTLKVATAPLEEDLRGVSIFSNGVWHETTLAANDKDMTQFIFGEIDIPKLDQDESPITPFNLSRAMRLNVENDLVRGIYAFVNRSIEVVRKKLAQAEKDRKENELSRRLADQANEIAEIINEDFNDFRREIAKVKAQMAGGYDYYGQQASAAEGDVLSPGNELPATAISDQGGIGADGDGGTGGTEPRTLNPELAIADDGPENAKPAGSPTERKPKRGGFQIQFRNMGSETHRAKYVSDERTIYINLDHPQLSGALKNRSVDDVVFKRLAYEVAFTEYAIALSSELASQGAYLDPFDPIVDIRETIQRIADRSAYLYAE